VQTGKPKIYFDAGPQGTGAMFEAPASMIVAWTPDEVPAALEGLAQATRAGRWLAGYASYELGYLMVPKLADSLPPKRDTPLLAFGVFGAPRPGPAPMTPGSTGLTPGAPNWELSDYDAAFQQVHGLIGAGDIYQANLTFALQSVLNGPPEALYAALQARQPVRYGAFVDFGTGPVIASRSPELFFATDTDGWIETRPMKGTIARGATQEQDDANRDWLQSDEKNRAENLMIVDLLRNDLSRIAQLDSVSVPSLFAIETYATVHQMVSRVRARLRHDITLPDILRALFPCGSITGAPKRRAMQVIRAVEPDPRGVYCGTIGWMAPDGASCFNVAIRTLSVFPDGKVRFNAGGGVVWDSRAEDEYQEALWKTRFTQIGRTG